MTLAISPHEPLVLADGTKIDPSTGKELRDVKRFVEIPSGVEAQKIVSRARRSVAELPLPSQQMNGVSLVLFYTLYGLGNRDIAHVTALSIEQVENIKALPEFASLRGDIKQSLLDTEGDIVRDFFQTRAMGAAQKIVDIAEEDDGALGFAASKDILDRAGHRPADTVHHHKITKEETLRIEYVERSNAASIPVIDVEYEVVDCVNLIATTPET